MSKKNEIILKNKKTEKYRQIHETINIGDWFWLEYKDYDRGYKKKVKKRSLFCVDEIGSNFVGFSRNCHNGTSGYRVHLDSFFEECTAEPNWKQILEQKLDEIQKQIAEKTRELIAEGKKLSLIPDFTKDHSVSPDNLLPVVSSVNPDKYKNDLIEFRDNKMPALQKEIEELAKDYAVVTKDLALSEMSVLNMMKGHLQSIEDRIFTVELYCGLKEQVHCITDGIPADIDVPITIYQQLLYMDEETLLDYNDGGMDFGKLEDFDKWVVMPKNLNRIMPDQKGIVAFRVRRNPKEYDIPRSLLDAWIQFHKDAYNMKTYLLIRNGEKVFRIATAIDFSPRLVPFRDEIGEKQFLKHHTRWHGEEEKEPDIITPDSIEFDKHVKKVDILIRKYNRIFILLQGLLDRSSVFHPHPSIKLMSSADIDVWIKCIRDEEDSLPNLTVTWDEYRDHKNKTIRKDRLVWSTWYPDDMGTWSSRHSYTDYSVKENEVINRPNICKVTAIKRDRSEVRISWTVKRWSWGYRDYRNSFGDWVDGGDRMVNRHLWVPMKHVFNITGYNKDEYKMFLCDRALLGKYLEWAPALLSAEDLSRKREAY